jgi:two-component system cell cycle response regulator
MAPYHGPVKDEAQAALRALRAAMEAAAAGDWVVPPAVEQVRGGEGDVAALADAFATLVERVRDRVGDLERTTTEFYRALDHLGEVLGSTHDRGAIVHAVLDTAALLVRPEAAVFYVHAGPRRLVARAVSGVASAGFELAVGEGVAGGAAASGEVVASPQVQPVAAEPVGPGASSVALPVRSGARPFGVLALYGVPDGRALSTSEVEALHSLASQAATAIENTFLYEEAARLSITDGLTGLWNRRQFDLRAIGEVQRAVRFSESFGVVMVDLDRFKVINDTYGHQTGDAVLVELARRLTEATRDVDLVARFGGEEFILMLPNTTCAGACIVGEKLRERIGEDPFVVDDLALDVTVSVGVASYPEHGSTVKELVAAADSALYRAKAGGRDRVEAA